ncbi:response regulator transcription factor [Dyadobacter sp. CY261]|uniref:response regulator transcription factor n=1 Tax=Dyadobacter sp. CY261 TaxID=2907203 RepID=UPI001F2441CE|nr:response regulator transcription factor [Dyadobacter sp. CY261]MCF0069494.1 response regulator transcription factor [Dyadobacter sp. CY261]
MKSTIAIVDDHTLMATALSGLVRQYQDYEVLYDVQSGRDLMHRLRQNMIPEIILLDVNMPEMTGFEVALWLKDNHPGIRVIALSMNDKEEAIVKMLRNGACGYLLKGCKAHELKTALDMVVSKGFYYSEFMTSQLIRSLSMPVTEDVATRLGLTQREKDFIQLACGDLTYIEIADKLCVSPRTVDGYREAVFQKMEVKSRTGMVIAAIRLKIISI